MKKYNKILKIAKDYLENLNKDMDNIVDESDEFYYAMKSFYDFSFEMNNIKLNDIYEFKVPEDIEKLLENINIKFKLRTLKEDKNMWFEHIQDSVARLIHVFTNLPEKLQPKERKMIQDSIEKHYKVVCFNIDYYEEHFKEKLPNTIRKSLEDCLEKLLKQHMIYIKTEEDIKLGELKFECVDYDAILELYEKIKNMKRGKEKNMLNKKLKHWVKILNGERK